MYMKTHKHPKQFRLSDAAVMTINRMARFYGMSQTAVVEQAIAGMERKTKKNDAHWLLQFAGTLPSDAADHMLASVYNHRHNKPIVNIP